MNKKLIIILSSSIIVVILIIAGVFYFVNQSNNEKTVINNPESDVTSEYTVEKGLEEMAKVAKPAVENYATQDITESLSARNKRLGAYFAVDSPVLGREIEIRSSNSATKNTAKVVSINSSNAEGQYPMLIVNTDITNYSGENKTQISQKYWITIKKNADGSYIADNIGLWEL